MRSTSTIGKTSSMPAGPTRWTSNELTRRGCVQGSASRLWRVIDYSQVEPTMDLPWNYSSSEGSSSDAGSNQRGLGPAIQLPKGGFEHPFHGSKYHLKGHGKEHPRIVSEPDSPPSLQVFDIASPGLRAADVYALQSYQRNPQLVGGGERRGER